MTARETYSAWLDLMNTEFGTDFRLDDAGATAIQFATGEVIFLQVLEPETLVVSTVVGPVDPRGDAAFLLRALALNIFPPVSVDGCLGFDPEAGNLIYCLRLRASTSNPVDLADRLNRFPSLLTAYREALDIPVADARAAEPEVRPTLHITA
jgi:hypothetical protein